VSCPPSSPITLASTIDVSTNLTIDGPGASDLAVSGNMAVEALDVSSGITASVSGLTLEDGDASNRWRYLQCRDSHHRELNLF
jgi:hypothetical protein